MTGRTIALGVVAALLAAAAGAYVVDRFWPRDVAKDEPFELLRKIDAMHDVRVDEKEAPATLFRVADQVCGGLSRCQIRYWVGEHPLPQSSPRTIGHGEYALYDRNRPEKIDMLIKDGQEIRR